MLLEAERGFASHPFPLPLFYMSTVLDTASLIKEGKVWGQGATCMRLIEEGQSHRGGH